MVKIKKITFLLPLLSLLAMNMHAQTKFKPEDTEYYSPELRTVTTTANGAPSDAIVLFNGTNLDQWIASNDRNKPQWLVHNNTVTVAPGKGNIQTKDTFEDFQLHIEWKSPEVRKGEGQGRGNSGIFLQGYYEIQVLDNRDNPTYVNGEAASLYKQQPPLVRVLANNDAWHSYDIVYSAPRFNKDGVLLKKGSVTVLHNGVLVQNNTQIEGTTEYIGLPKIIAHGAGPIILQDHGDLVQFRNIWIRRL